MENIKNTYKDRYMENIKFIIIIFHTPAALGYGFEVIALVT